MKKAMIAGLVVSLAAAAQAVVVLPEGVDEYRIIFTDYKGVAATNTNIEWYNAHITEKAELSTELLILSIEHGLDWYCVGSTETVDARDNISPGIAWDAENVPIYNTHGLLVANNIADLFDGSIVKHVDYDQWGESGFSPYFEVWTGTDRYGAANVQTYSDYYGELIWGTLGSTTVTMGDSAMRDEAWLEWAWDDPVERKYLYGISSPIPEPSTIGLLGIAGLGLFLGRKKSHR